MWWIFFFQILAPENLQNHFFFESFIFKLSLFGEIPPKKKTKREALLPLPWRLCASDYSDKCKAAMFPLSRGSRRCLWSHFCRSRACRCSTSRACEEPSQVAAVVGEEEQAFSEFFASGGVFEVLSRACSLLSRLERNTNLVAVVL